MQGILGAQHVDVLAYDRREPDPAQKGVHGLEAGRSSGAALLCETAQRLFSAILLAPIAIGGRYARAKRFYGIVVKLIYMDNEQHHKPHVHVKYGDYKASISLDGEVLVGGIPMKQYRMVSAWLSIHEDELYSAWNKAVAGEPFAKIAPLS